MRSLESLQAWNNSAGHWRTRLDVAVHEAASVQIRERGGDCRRRNQRVDGVAAARQRVGQQLHHQTHAAVRVNEPAVQLHQVRMPAAAR